MVRACLRIKQKGRKKNSSGGRERERIQGERANDSWDDITWTPGSAVSGLISDLNNKSFMLKIVEHSFCYLTPKKSCVLHTHH